MKSLEKYNIHRQFIKQLEESEYVNRVSKGLYVKAGKELNEFYILNQKYKKSIFSRNTALYFYNLTDRTPIQLDITIPSYMTIHDNSVKIHYIKEELHSVGAIKMKLQDGTIVQIYNIEITICDIIRDRDKLDPQISNDAIKNI